MRITQVNAVPITGGNYYDDKAAFRAGKVQIEHHLVRGEPVTPGFKKVREVARGVGVVLRLEDGVSAFGDGTSVQYAGAAGRDPLFRFEEHAGAFDEVIGAWLVGKDVSEFVRLAEGVEALSWKGKRLHTAVRYGLSQALLEGAALALRRTKAGVLAESYGLKISSAPLRILVQSGEDRYVAVDKAIYHRADVFPHALVKNVARDLGQRGEKLMAYARWIMSRLEAHEVEPEYQPTIHFDCYGTIGQAFEWNVDRMCQYMMRLEKAVSPLALEVESPVEMETQAAQMEMLGSLRRALRAKGGRVVLIADEWCNTLEDVKLFARAKVADMIQIKMPDLGGIGESVKAVLECKRHGVGAYLGGSCVETDLNARNAVHVAVATGADQVLARPGMGVDEAVCIMRNEEARTRALMKRE